jgi:C4-dicarboxylate-specific signal transduction histidine kinase
MIISGRCFQLKRGLQNGTLNDKDALASCEKIEATVARIAAIVENLRLFSGETSAQVTRKAATLRGVIADTLSLCQEKFHADGVELSCKMPDDDYSINGDAVKISQALLNLLTNAMKAVANLPDKWVRIDAHEASQTLTIRVTDSGRGIPHHLVDKIFQPFFTTQDIGAGTGLGLSVSRGIVESMGGRLELDKYSANTSFVITVPCDLAHSVPKSA